MKAMCHRLYEEIAEGWVALLTSKKDMVMRGSGKEFSSQTTTPESKGGSAP